MLGQLCFTLVVKLLRPCLQLILMRESKQNSQAKWCKSIELRQGLKTEIIYAHVESEYKFSCPNCHKTYKHKTSVMQHMRLECTTGPQFVCPHCSRKFNRNSTLNRHLILIHQVTGQKLKRGRPSQNIPIE